MPTAKEVLLKQAGELVEKASERNKIVGGALLNLLGTAGEVLASKRDPQSGLALVDQFQEGSQRLRELSVNLPNFPQELLELLKTYGLGDVPLDFLQEQIIPAAPPGEEVKGQTAGRYSPGEPETTTSTKDGVRGDEGEGLTEEVRKRRDELFQKGPGPYTITDVVKVLGRSATDSTFRRKVQEIAEDSGIKPTGVRNKSYPLTPEVVDRIIGEVNVPTKGRVRKRVSAVPERDSTEFDLSPEQLFILASALRSEAAKTYFEGNKAPFTDSDQDRLKKIVDDGGQALTVLPGQKGWEEFLLGVGEKLKYWREHMSEVSSRFGEEDNRLFVLSFYRPPITDKPDVFFLELLGKIRERTLSRDDFAFMLNVITNLRRGGLLKVFGISDALYQAIRTNLSDMFGPLEIDKLNRFGNSEYRECFKQFVAKLPTAGDEFGEFFAQNDSRVEELFHLMEEEVNQAGQALNISFWRGMFTAFMSARTPPRASQEKVEVT